MEPHPSWLCDDDLTDDQDLQQQPSLQIQQLPERKNAQPDLLPPSPPRPDSLTPAQREWDERKRQLVAQHGASRPQRFFSLQVQAELEWLDENQLLEERGTVSLLPRGPDLDELARKNVLANWSDWGIANRLWSGLPARAFDSDQWMHEKGYEYSSNLGVCNQSAEMNRMGYGQGDGDWGVRSRPCDQFFAHISLERTRMYKETCSRPAHPWHRRDYYVKDYNARLAQWELDKQAYQARPEGGAPPPLNLNTAAYDRVKARWKKWGVWNDNWGVLPGMSWQHERPLEDFLREQMLGEYPKPDSKDPSKTASEDSSPEPRSFRSAAPTPMTVAPKDERSVSPHVAPQEAAPQLSVADNHPTQSQGDTQPASTPTTPGGNLSSSMHIHIPPWHCPDQHEQKSPVPARRGQQTARSSSSGSDADVSGASSSALGPIRPGRVSKTPRAHHCPSKALETAAASRLLAPKLEILDESEVPDSPRMSKRLLAAVEKESIKVEEE